MQSHPPTHPAHPTDQPVDSARQPARRTSGPGPAASRPGPTPSLSAIEARGLVKTYPAPGKNPRIRALDGLDLTVAPGTIYALVGPNGAGKSTTVKILTTLAIADEGTATVEGIDVRTDPARARRVIGVVGQRSGADPTATGRENLVLQGHLYGQSTRDAKLRADELLERFALTDAGGRFVRTYSGGMQRRLDVALGLMHRPKVLFLDEPTTGLDPEARTAMWDEITRLAESDQITVLLTTHYLDEADRLAGRLAVVDRGRVVAEGEPARLKQDLGVTSLDEVYLHYAGRRFSDATRVTEVAGR
jgi:ABC-2 type transport system ATP-binding protein